MNSAGHETIGEQDWAGLLDHCKEELRRGQERHVGLQLVCDYLQTAVPHYDWVGLYLVVSEEAMLVLGPYQGAPTEHVRIPFGVGICGQVAERAETMVVDDVRAQSNYLSCSIHVRSEIVVPVMDRGMVCAEFDIDSHSEAAFTDADARFLEALAPHLVAHLPALS